MFCPSLKLILSGKPNWTQLDPLASKNNKNGHISKRHFDQVSITKIPAPPTFFNEFVLNFQNRCKYGFRGKWAIMYAGYTADIWGHMGTYGGYMADGRRTYGKHMAAIRRTCDKNGCGHTPL